MIFPSYLGIISSNRFLTIASYENDFTDLKNESEGDIKRTERITLVTDQANSGIEIKRVHAKSKDKIRGKSGIRIGDAVVMIAHPRTSIANPILRPPKMIIFRLMGYRYWIPTIG